MKYKELKTTVNIAELSSQDLKRLMIPNNRVYLAWRGKTYHDEKIYEFVVMSKNKTQVVFATEEDLLNKNKINVQDIEFLEEKPLVSYMESTFFNSILHSDKIFMANFPTLFSQNFKKISQPGYKFTFANLAILNNRSIKDQKAYVDKQEKEFEETQEYLLKKAPISLRDF